MNAIPATAERPRVGRKARQPDATSREWHARLGRLIDRKRKGRSNEAIAEAAGISPNNLTQILSGRTKNPGLKTIERILKALPATFADLERA